MRSVVAVVAIAFALGGCSLDPPPPASVGASGVFDLDIGDCFDGAGANGEVSSVPVVSCASKHEFEVYASSRMDAAAYPGEDTTADEADASCAAAFEDFLGESFETAHTAGTYDFTSLYPTAASWDLGDRQVLCAITTTDDQGMATKTRGSLAGAAR